MLDLLNQIVSRVAAGELVGVCFVAWTRGSTPQKAGATMLVLQGGQTLGTLGGGCVEAEVRVRTLQSLRSEQNRLLSFRLDHDYGWDDGLVCGGAMDILVCPVATTAQAEPWRAAAAELAAGRSATLKLSGIDEAGEARQFEHVLHPRPTLLIAGAGHVGAALAALAPGMDFDAVVVDDRPDMASAARLGASSRCVVGPIDVELARFPVTEHTYVVIVTRGHRHDADALAAAVASPARYVGLIGSRRKIVTILRDLRGRGVPVERLAEVHAPIGLSLGAVTPGEIAVSIAAELIAYRRGPGASAGQSLKLTAEQLERLFAAEAKTG